VEVGQPVDQLDAHEVQNTYKAITGVDNVRSQCADLSLWDG